MMTLLLLAFILLLLIFAAPLAMPQRPHRTRRCPRPRSATSEPPPAPVRRVQPPKPPWVRREVLRLKALMPEAGCRRIAHTFNRLHQNRRAMTVGKTFVAGVLRNRGEEVLRIRREIKHRTPRPLRRNVIWALDWTWMPGEGGDSRPVFGLLDHGSRACLELCPVESRRTVTLLRQLLELFERFGTPKVLRTDNEPAVRSLLFRVVLRILGIRHQRSEPFAPWQNGRIERLFRTVKEVIQQRDAATGSPRSPPPTSPESAPGTTTSVPTNTWTGVRLPKHGAAKNPIDESPLAGCPRGAGSLLAATGPNRTAHPTDTETTPTVRRRGAPCRRHSAPEGDQADEARRNPTTNRAQSRPLDAQFGSNLAQNRLDLPPDTADGTTSREDTALHCPNWLGCGAEAGEKQLAGPNAP